MGDANGRLPTVARCPGNHPKATGLGAQNWILTGEDHEPWKNQGSVGRAQFALQYRISEEEAEKHEREWRDPNCIHHWSTHLSSEQERYMIIDGLCPILMMWTALQSINKGKSLHHQDLIPAIRSAIKNMPPDSSIQTSRIMGDTLGLTPSISSTLGEITSPEDEE